MTNEVTDADRRIHELEGQLADTTSELETTRAELRRRETTIESMQTAELRRGIAEETGMPEHILIGSTREELISNARELKQWAAKSTPGRARSGPLRGGAGKPPSHNGPRQKAAATLQGLGPTALLNY